MVLAGAGGDVHVPYDRTHLGDDASLCLQESMFPLETTRASLALQNNLDDTGNRLQNCADYAEQYIQNNKDNL